MRTVAFKKSRRILWATLLLCASALNAQAASTNDRQYLSESRNLVAPVFHDKKDSSQFFLNVDILWSNNPEAQPLILLPGGPALTADYLVRSGLAWHLKKDFHLIFIHPRASRKSPLSSNDEFNGDANNVRSLLSDIRLVQDLVLKSKPAYILGHSFGGTLAILYSGLHSDRVLGTVCLNCSPDTSNWQDYISSYFQVDFPYLEEHIRLRKPSADMIVKILGGWQKLLEKVRKGEAKYKVGEYDWVIDEVELRSLFRPILQRKSEFVLRYIDGLLNSNATILKEVAADWAWTKINDNLRAREFLYCNELLPESTLQKTIFASDKSIEDYYCGKFQIVRQDPLDEAAIKANIKNKVLVFHGKFDFIVPFSQVKKGFDQISNKKLIRLESSSHYSHNQQPEDIWRKIKEEFL